MYLIFIMRIHYVYKDTIYAIKTVILKLYAIIMIIIYLFCHCMDSLPEKAMRNIIFFTLNIKTCLRHHGNLFLY